MSTLFVIIGAKIGGLIQGLNSAKNEMSNFTKATQSISQSIMGGNVMGAFDGIAAAAASCAVPMGVLSAAVAGVTLGIGSWKAIEKANELTKIADASGFAITELLSLERAFGSAGIKLQELPAITGQFRMGLESLKDPTSRVSLALTKLNLNSKNFEGKTAIEALKTLAKAIDKANDSGKALAATSALFGLEKGGKMAQVLTASNIEKSERQTNPAAKALQDAAPIFLQIQSTFQQALDGAMSFFTGFAAEVAPLILRTAESFRGMGQFFFEAGTLLGKIINYVQSFVDTLLSSFVKIFGGAMNSVFFNAANILIQAFGKITGMDVSKKLFDTSQFKEDIKQGIEWLKDPDILTKVTEARKEAAKKESLDQTAIPKIPEIPTGKPLAPIVDSLTKAGAEGTSWASTDTQAIQKSQLDQLTKINANLESIKLTKSLDIPKPIDMTEIDRAISVLNKSLGITEKTDFQKQLESFPSVDTSRNLLFKQSPINLTTSGVDGSVSVQRDQLIQQTRMANALDKFINQFQPAKNPLIGITPNFLTA